MTSDEDKFSIGAASSSDDTSSSNEVAALVALYQAERADGTSVQASNIAIVALVAAYVGATATLLDPDKFVKLPAVIVVLLPLPVVILLVFVVSLGLVQGRRAVSAKRLEDVIYTLSGLPARNRSGIGLEFTETIYNVSYARGLPRICVIIFQFGGGVIVATYCLGLTVLAWTKLGPEAVVEKIVVASLGLVYVATIIVAALTALRDKGVRSAGPEVHSAVEQGPEQRAVRDEGQDVSAMQTVELPVERHPTSGSGP